MEVFKPKEKDSYYVSQALGMSPLPEPFKFFIAFPVFTFKNRLYIENCQVFLAVIC